jgi:hypothetical protein
MRYKHIIYFYMYIDIYYTGWWFQPTPLKNDGVRQWVSDDIPYILYMS